MNQMKRFYFKGILSEIGSVTQHKQEFYKEGTLVSIFWYSFRIWLLSNFVRQKPHFLFVFFQQKKKWGGGNRVRDLATLLGSVWSFWMLTWPQRHTCKTMLQYNNGIHPDCRSTVPTYLTLFILFESRGGAERVRSFKNPCANLFGKPYGSLLVYTVGITIHTIWSSNGTRFLEIIYRVDFFVCEKG